MLCRWPPRLVLVAAAPPVAAAPRGAARPVLVVADVGESARRSMPAALWRKLAADVRRPRTAAAEDGTALPDDARCRSAHAHTRCSRRSTARCACRGWRKTPTAPTAIARFTVRNCTTGVVSRQTVRVESEPLSTIDRADDELTERAWERAVRATLARDPLLLAARSRRRRPRRRPPR